MNRPRFEHAMLMSGGSSRFGYYLGIYAALVDAGKQPDIIFASCGGAISAGIISTFDSISEQKEVLMSHEIHHLLTRLQANKQQSLFRVLTEACQRLLNQRASEVFPDLYRSAIFEVADDDKPLFPFTPAYSSKQTEFAIIGSSLSFTPEDVGNERGDNTLFEEVVFTGDKLFDTINGRSFTPNTPLIKNTIRTESAISFQDAIRVSLSDIYYLPPYRLKQREYMGGMLDLVPFNLATQCASAITLERKQAFSTLTAVPAFNKLLGFNPNTRQQAIPVRQQDIWVDTADAPQWLKQNQINKRIDWHTNKIHLDVPPYDQFAAMMEAQWSYGYQRGSQAVVNSANKGKH